MSSDQSFIFKNFFVQFVQKTKRQEVVKNGEKKAHAFLYILQLTMSQFAMKNWLYRKPHLSKTGIKEFWQNTQLAMEWLDFSKFIQFILTILRL